MNHYCYVWIEEWCQENGWTDLFLRERREYWAFPPNAVMPLPVPSPALKQIKQQKGFSQEERRWCWTAVASAVLGTIASYAIQSPMPLVAAFSFCAIVVAQLEIDD